MLSIEGSAEELSPNKRYFWNRELKIIAFAAEGD